MRASVLAPLLLAATLAIPPVLAEDAMPSLRPEQVGQIFCLSRLGGDEGAIDGLLTPELRHDIAAAQQHSDAWAAANPGEKPPLGDGIPWQSWPDYAAECSVGLVTLMRTDAQVEIAYGFPEAPEAGFTDTLLLRRLNGPVAGVTVWRIDNISYATGGTLQSALTDAVEGY